MWLLHASETRTGWPWTTEIVRSSRSPGEVSVPSVQPPQMPLSRIRLDQRADTDPTPSWSVLVPPPGIGVRRTAPAMMRARVASGQVARVGARATSWAAMPATIGLAMLVPLPIVPFAVRTLTAGRGDVRLVEVAVRVPRGARRIAVRGAIGRVPQDVVAEAAVLRSLMPPTVSTL